MQVGSSGWLRSIYLLAIRGDVPTKAIKPFCSEEPLRKQSLSAKYYAKECSLSDASVWGFPSEIKFHLLHDVHSLICRCHHCVLDCLTKDSDDSDR